MRTSYNLLCSYLPLSLAPEELSRLLTQQGLEVESILPYGQNLDSFLVAQVLSKKPHPDADKLSVCQVSVGKETFQVVCGASNFGIDDKVVFAPVGTVMPSGKMITKTSIREVDSEGMLCSGKELELFDSSEGLWILPKDAPLGIPISTFLPDIKDFIFDLALTPNRGDCLSTLGIAREVAILENKLLTNSHPSFSPTSSEKFNLDIQIKTPHCRRYLGFLVKNVTVKESPLWLKMALSKYGLRSINNIVDISNYVMLERGTPIHIFDFDKLKFPLTIKEASQDETITPLSGKALLLPKGSLVIADNNENVALAGIMGGGSSKVSEKTTNLFIEIAHFDADTIRQTTKTLNMNTDAAYRFMRQVDVQAMPSSMHFLLEHLFKTTSGDFVSFQDVYPTPYEEKTISLSRDFITQKLGFTLAEKDIETILTKLSLSHISPSSGTYEIKVPSYRHDLSIDMDIVEELIRIYGYEKLPSFMPTLSFPKKASTSLPLEFFVRDLLTLSGSQEVYNFSFLTKEKNDLFSLLGEQSIALINPLNSDFSYLRTSLFAGASSYIKEMFSQGRTDLSIFEIGQIFYKENSKFTEKKHLFLAKSGIQQSEGLFGEKIQNSFYTLKSSLQTLFIHLGVDAHISYEENQNTPFLHPHKSAQVLYNGVSIGYLGEVHPEFYRDVKKKTPLVVAEIELSIFDTAPFYQKERSYEPFSRFPKIERDLSFVFDKTLKASEILSFIEPLSPLITSVDITDQYEDIKLGENKKNLSFRITFQSSEKTLAELDIKPLITDIIEFIQKEKQGILREF